MSQDADATGGPERKPNCAETIQTLYEFLDGELTDDRRSEIGHHLDNCHPCLKAYDFEAELRQMIASRCRDHVPDNLRFRIAAAIEAERQRAAGTDPGSKTGPAREESGPV
jgi:mycothiol system anti-sigma-R factor